MKVAGKNILMTAKNKIRYFSVQIAVFLYPNCLLHVLNLLMKLLSTKRFQGHLTLKNWIKVISR